MTPAEFWELIARSRDAVTSTRDGNQDRQCKRLRELLSPLSAAEIQSFREHFYTFVSDASDWDLWAVATIVGQGCSDDWFAYFRFWLISLGRDAYEQALADPASVDRLFKETSSEDYFFEQISYVPGRLYREKTGVEPPTPRGRKRKFKGKPWKSDEELAARYPQLVARHWR